MPPPTPVALSDAPGAQTALATALIGRFAAAMDSHDAGAMSELLAPSVVVRQPDGTSCAQLTGESQALSGYQAIFSLTRAGRAPACGTRPSISQAPSPT